MIYLKLSLAYSDTLRLVDELTMSMIFSPLSSLLASLAASTHKCNQFGLGPGFLDIHRSDLSTSKQGLVLNLIDGP